MRLWGKFMTFLGLRPAQKLDLTTPPAVVRMNQDLDDQLREALSRHQAASREVISRSFDALQRALDAQVAIKHVTERIEKNLAAETIEGAYQLLSREPPHDDDDP